MTKKMLITEVEEVDGDCIDGTVHYWPTLNHHRSENIWVRHDRLIDRDRVVIEERMDGTVHYIVKPAPEEKPRFNVGDKILTFCPECGPNIQVDEDGLCVSCGATAVGAGVESLNKPVPEPERYTPRCDMEAGPCACGAWHEPGEPFEEFKPTPNEPAPKLESTELGPIIEHIEILTPDPSEAKLYFYENGSTNCPSSQSPSAPFHVQGGGGEMGVTKPNVVLEVKSPNKPDLKDSLLSVLDGMKASTKTWNELVSILIEIVHRPCQK